MMKGDICYIESSFVIVVRILKFGKLDWKHDIDVDDTWFGTRIA